MRIKTVIIFMFSLFILSCQSDLEVIDDISELDYALLNQDSVQTHFPSLIKDKIGVVGYIFTNCPDICPMTTNNMRLIRDKVENQKIENVEFISISFDPDVDKPSVLKRFSELHNVNVSNWEFLTGKKSTIEDLLKKTGIIAFVSDSTTFDDGSKTYYYLHTDRIQLIDEDGRIRKNYLGSKINIDEIVSDIKKLN